VATSRFFLHNFLEFRNINFEFIKKRDHRRPRARNLHSHMTSIWFPRVPLYEATQGKPSSPPPVPLLPHPSFPASVGGCSQQSLCCRQRRRGLSLRAGPRRGSYLRGNGGGSRQRSGLMSVAQGGRVDAAWWACRGGVILLVDVGDQRSLCVVNDQPVGNPKRKV
jgi:hypothetical protein